MEDEQDVKKDQRMYQMTGTIYQRHTRDKKIMITEYSKLDRTIYRDVINNNENAMYCEIYKS